MKVSTVIVAATAAYTVSAQLESIPQCALSCALSGIGQTGCASSDIACICSAQAFVTSLVPCVTSGCSEDDFAATIVAASALCAEAGVTLNIPTGGAPVPSSSSASESASMTTAAPTMSTTETVVEVPTNTTTTATEEETSAPPPSNGTVTEPPAPTGTEDAGASRNAISIGGLGALVAFVAALL